MYSNWYAHINRILDLYIAYAGKKITGVLKNHMATFNGCDRILKEDVCLEKLFFKTVDNQLSNYLVTSICLCIG